MKPQAGVSIVSELKNLIQSWKKCYPIRSHISMVQFQYGLERHKAFRISLVYISVLVDI